MSEMSFKQAKEIVEKLEFSELALRKSFKDINTSSKVLNETTKELEKSLEKQKLVLTQLPTMNKKINVLRSLIMINIGFILGLFVGKYLL
ncbi:hypothetical protein CRU99_12850 [Malaciobacter mytili]|uniref:DUF1640 domain-containing protein n=2 Tax=Malaciobacter mytili TaxID=603050 RepID=A0AAX2AJF8_9BACT|nr:hypothetical protein AMYT_0535 [Malaciobacter mytili LMG 24559]RXI36997.1 hypothetical protein CRU99_12850 [Malaciobacter mytili]RXK17018.1 hypothetical protein CP985_00945 [Malaciobacter mytili LMG 24559]